jgi:hypothetical protein
MPNRGEQGTGRHPHKSTAESEKGHKASGRGSESSGESSDLKSREYRDKDGNIHHHTRTYERDHPGKSR